MAAVYSLAGMMVEIGGLRVTGFTDEGFSVGSTARASYQPDADTVTGTYSEYVDLSNSLMFNVPKAADLNNILMQAYYKSVAITSPGVVAIQLAASNAGTALPGGTAALSPAVNPTNGLLTINIIGTKGEFVFRSETCKILEIPEFSFKKDAGSNVWKIHSATPQALIIGRYL